ncbi:vomeronasal type-2 receptor 1-like [Protopterus annectens]|uniref:vomeronasal type-2 receptor 1-like n=1 Tax=Protopterus annectens TaxID=7888 RepID=UPI001CFAF34A|nr:vomeronasal type-2 receptor 1-like [Protopterus annectens]
MIFAIGEINQSYTILPNITLGFWILDSCYAVGRSLEGTMWLITGQSKPVPNYCCQSQFLLSAVIGDSSSVRTIPMARMLGLSGYPHISYAASVTALSNKMQFPSFVRTIPSDDAQSKGLAQLIIHFNWTWVGIVASENEYGEIGSQILRDALNANGACVAFYEIIPAVYSKVKIQRIIATIIQSTANAIAVFSSESIMLPLMDGVSKVKPIGKTWICCESWCTSPVISKKDLLEMLQHTIGFALPQTETSELKAFLYSIHPSSSLDTLYVDLFWEEVFGCRWVQLNKTIIYNTVKICDGKEHLEKVNISLFDVYNYNVYKAVYAVAHALNDLLSCSKNNGPFVNQTCANIFDFQPWQIPRSVCSESCALGNRKASIQGQPTCCFDCILCSEGEITNQTDVTDCMKCPEDHWSSDNRDKCIPKTPEFLSYDDPLGMTLAGASLCFFFIPFTTLLLFIKHRETPIVKANNRHLSYLLLFALMMCFLCALVFIGYPVTVTCMLRHVVFGTIFALCVSCVLAKTITVIIVFSATNPNSSLKNWVGHKLPLSIVLFGVMLQVFICTAWLATSPPFKELDMISLKGKIVVGCNEGATYAFWCMLGYIGLLAVVCFILAFLARKLPDTFNEAKFITFSMLVFVSVWISFIPAYLSTNGKYMVALEVFAILSSSAGLLGCIFIPKCYTIIFRPDLNVKQHIAGKGKQI